MRLGEARGSTCTLLLVCFLALRLAASLQCLSQSLEDVVIDIQSSLSRGVRGSEPTHTQSPRECISSCCSTRNISGDRDCNLMIFDTRKASNQPNCYLFFCPSADACPLKPAKGLRSYRIIRESPSSSTAAELTSPGQWSQAAPSSAPTPGGSLKPSDVSVGDVWSQKSGFSGHLEKLLRTGPASSSLPGHEGEDHSPSSHFSEQNQAPLGPEYGAALPRPAATAARRPPTSATLQLAASGTPVVQSQVATTVGPVTTAPTRPPTGLPATIWTGGVTLPPVSTMTTPVTLRTGMTVALTASSQAVTRLRAASPTMPGPEASSLTSNTSTREATTLPLSSLDSGPVNETSSQETGLHLGAASLESVPDRRYGLPFEKWLLVGSLVFGVLFLAISLVLMGRMLLASLRRKRYSRLDYLINGIYVGL